MISLKSKLVNATLAATATIPLATAGMFISAGSAQAAALKGEFSFNGGLTGKSTTSVVTLKKDSLTFTPDSIFPGATGAKSSPIALASQTGSFLGFNSASIRDIISFTNNTVQNPFLDLGNLLYAGRIQTTENTSSLNDNKNIFTLTSSKYNLAQSGKNLSIDVELLGFFTSATGEITQAAGNLTFQKNNITLAQANKDLNDGKSLANLTFSGATFTTSVPEPSFTVGLGFVGVGLVMSRRRKSVAQ